MDGDYSEESNPTTTLWTYLLLVAAGIHLIVIYFPQSRVGQWGYVGLFFAHTPLAVLASYFDTKQLYGTSTPTPWRSRGRRLCWVVVLSAPVTVLLFSVVYLIRRRELASETQFPWHIVVAVAPLFFIVAAFVGSGVDEPASSTELTIVYDTVLMSIVFSWLVTPGAGYLDLSNRRRQSTQSTTVSFTQSTTDRWTLLKRTVVGVGLAIPYLNASVAVAYVFRRREHQTANKPHWRAIAVVGLILTVAALIGLVALDDPNLEENTLGQDLAAAVFVSTWPLLPISVYYDGGYVSKLTDWPARRWTWVLGTTVWFINLAVVPVYLYYRQTKLRTITDIRDELDELLSDTERLRQDGKSHFEAAEYDQARELFGQVREQLREARGLATDTVPDRVEDIEQRLETIDRHETEATARHLVEQGDRLATETDTRLENREWHQASDVNTRALESYQKALTLAEELERDTEPLEQKIQQREAVFDESVLRQMLEDAQRYISEGDHEHDDGNPSSAYDLFQAAMDLLDETKTLAGEDVSSLRADVDSLQTTVDERLDQLDDAVTRERVATLRAEGDEALSLARDALSSGSYEQALTACDSARDSYQTGLDTARNIDTEQTTTLEQRLEQTESLLDEIADERRAYETATENLDEISNALDTIESSFSGNDHAQAIARLDEIAGVVADTAELTSQLSVDSLSSELDTQRDRYDTLRTRATKRSKVGPPTEIPSPERQQLQYDTIEKRRPIGSGGNADVFYATTDDESVTLAIKEPRMSGTLHTETIERMLDEAETWQKLDDHDHIVSVVDYGAEPLPWIGMEYMDAGHLGERASTLEFEQALWTAIAVTRAVRHAHRNGVAHLDLKPENILFRAVDGRWDVPKVADWGLSKQLLDHSNSVEGLSPQYAAPEQFDGEFGASDDLTDVYQLGAVLYELFTGRPPFEGEATKVMRAVLDDDPAPPSDYADIPGELDNILLTALAKEKENRYESVIYLRDELQNLQTHTGE